MWRVIDDVDTWATGGDMSWRTYCRDVAYYAVVFMVFLAIWVIRHAFDGSWTKIEEIAILLMITLPTPEGSELIERMAEASGWSPGDIILGSFVMVAKYGTIGSILKVYGTAFLAVFALSAILPILEFAAVKLFDRLVGPIIEQYRRKGDLPSQRRLR